MTRRDKACLIIGIFNLIWPFFAYDLAALASLTIWGYGWGASVPMNIMLLLPIVSDVACIGICAVRYYKRQKMPVLLGMILSIAAIAVYYLLRLVMNFSLGWVYGA